MLTKESLFQCKEPDCPWDGMVRTVPWRVATVGAWQRPSFVVCECSPKVEMHRLPDHEE